MNNKKIKSYLIVSILGLTIIPLVGSIFLINEIFDHAASLALNEDTLDIFNDAQQDLKALSEAHPELEEEYRNRFEKISQALVVYQNPTAVKSVLRNTYVTYYLIIVALYLLAAIALAVVLSRKVSRAYAEVLQKHITNERRVQQLVYLEDWKSVADRIAHEMKNALTPIELKMSSLVGEYRNAENRDFEVKLNESRELVQVEIKKLKDMVFNFSSYAKLPEPKLKPHKVATHLTKFIQQYSKTWPELDIQCDIDNNAKNATCNLDSVLFNQALINIINNAVEANEGVNIELKISLFMQGKKFVALKLKNNGSSIDEYFADKIFTMYYTRKPGKGNAGLGLAIVKKIMLEHGGDIELGPCVHGVVFLLLFPVIESHEY